VNPVGRILYHRTCRNGIQDVLNCRIGSAMLKRFRMPRRPGIVNIMGSAALCSLFWALTTSLLAAAAQADEVGLRVIVVDTEARAIDLWTRVQAGEPFAELASEYSTDPTRTSGGFLGTVRLADLSPAYRQALEGLVRGQVSPVTRIGRQYVLLQLLDAVESQWLAAMDSGMQALGEGRLSEAEARLTDAVLEAERLGPDDFRLNVSLSTLAGLHRVQGNYAEAAALYRRALDLAERAVGRRHPDFAVSLGNLALVYREQGDYEQAETLLVEAQEILVETEGPNHPDVAVGLVALARLRTDQGNLARAESLYQVALSIFEQALGPNDPRVADTLEELAALAREAGRASEASGMEAQAQRIRAGQTND